MTKQTRTEPKASGESKTREPTAAVGGLNAFLSSSAWLLALVVIASLPRLILLLESDFGIESDEAVVGLMAKHIVEGRDIPIFYYGQNYLGSLEAVVVAGAFQLFGVSNYAVKLVPFAFSLLFVLATYFLARQYTSKYGARVASLLAAVPPQALVLWSIKARGGFIELLLIGSLSLIVGTRAIRSTTTLNIALLGLLLGLGWWVNNQIIFYLAALFLVLPCLVIWREGLWAALGGVLLCGLFFLLGSCLFWHANLTSTPRFASFETLFGGSRDSLGLTSITSLSDLGHKLEGFYGSVIEPHFSGLVSEALPIIFGARRFWSEQDIYPQAWTVVLALYGLALVAYLLTWLQSRWRGRKEGVSPRFSVPYVLPLLFILCTAAIFSFSHFGWLSKAPRYLLPLYSVIFVILGVGAASIQRLLGTTIANIFVFLLLTINLASNYLKAPSEEGEGWSYAVNQPGEPFVYGGERVSRDHQALYTWLEKHDYTHILTDYWIGYRTAFETSERVTFSRFSREGPIRIPEYEGGKGSGEESVYVLVPSQAEFVKRELAARGFSFRENSVGEYIVLDWVVPVSWRGAPIDSEKFKVASEFNSENLQSLVDGNPGTRWVAGGPQREGMGVVFEFVEPLEVSGLDIEMGFWPHDMAVRLVIDLKDQDGNWCSSFDSRGMDIFSEWRQVWEFYFRPKLVTGLRLRQLGEHPIFDWSIADVRIYGTKGSPVDGLGVYPELEEATFSERERIVQDLEKSIATETEEKLGPEPKEIDKNE